MSALLDFSPAALLDFSPAEWTAIHLSLRIATVATIVSLPFGIFTAYALARWRFPGKTLVNGIIHLPLVLPPVVTGFVLLSLLGKKGVFGAFLASIGIVLSFRWTGAAVACAVMGFPLMVRAMRLSFEAIDRRLELASGKLGCNRIWTFLLVTLPLAAPGIVVGGILAFAKALGEFGARSHSSRIFRGNTDHIGRDLLLHASPGRRSKARCGSPSSRS